MFGSMGLRNGATPHAVVQAASAPVATGAANTLAIPSATANKKLTGARRSTAREEGARRTARPVKGKALIDRRRCEYAVIAWPLRFRLTAFRLACPDRPARRAKVRPACR